MSEPFATVPDAARALLAVETLTEREGQFCGGLAFRAAPITDRQAHWLRILLERHGLPQLIKGGSDVH
ncbi:hypothetical protein NED98_13080 [Sphingomonas sp. MMSM20]|uniref:hypothetical protein n=1 Tax=Sphingomonas lycopersici TaxID=2951807 RepID=UPI0015C8DFBF|nr:hypothetical protein [Sphingomonas lycopersici]MCW6531179.1 hypothetical protein [Sphingomonas lycopersici]